MLERSSLELDIHFDEIETSTNIEIKDYIERVVQTLYERQYSSNKVVGEVLAEYIPLNSTINFNSKENSFEFFITGLDKKVRTFTINKKTII